jgi:Tfp pilus assembly protein PilW
MLLVAVASGYYFCARSFSDLSNYLVMDSDSRAAFDLMGRDIRQADRLSSYASNQLVFQSGSTQITFNYHYCPGIEWCDVDLALCSSGREACEKV